MGFACTEKASRAVGVVVRAACPAAAYGFDVELVSVLATRVPTVACTEASTSSHPGLCCHMHQMLVGLFAAGLRLAHICGAAGARAKALRLHAMTTVLSMPTNG